MEERSPVTFVQKHNDSCFHLSKSSCNGLKMMNNILNKVCFGNLSRKSLKRKVSEDEEIQHTSMTSYSNLNNKKPRITRHGRSLPVTRLLEHLDASSLRNIIQILVNRHPTLSLEVVNLSSRPDLSSVISILNGMEEQVRRSFPYGGDSAGEYAYNRIRPVLQTLTDSLLEYTCIFLPPYETDRSLTLTFLDYITSMVHRFPEWNNPEHNYAKHELYDEISNAWVSTILSIAKEGSGGINSHEWMEKLIKHNEVAGGRFKTVIDVAQNELSWSFPENFGKNGTLLSNNKFGFDFASCYRI
ncbi:hypothetical protein PCK1_000294 [Pneumocystis canis]|nr:hypothetical protein PCK1_000294 [Pneumocystis canis]